MNTNNRQPIASIRQVCKSFDEKPALTNVDLDLYQAEVLAILGPNGAGKTTLINTMLGRLSPTSGEISLFGHPAGSMQVKRQTGAMLQVSGLPDMSTIKEHIQLFRSYYPQPMDYEKIMEFSGLKAIENQFSKTLSGGQKQRLLFALAICGNPKLLFLDEPTVSMDITARKSFWQAIEALKSQGTSILLTTHYLDEADQFSDRIIMLNNGKVIREGTPKAIKSQINTKKIRFSSQANIASLSAIERVSKVSKVSKVSNGCHYYELESTCAETSIRQIFDQQLEVNDLTIIGGALEDAFELINKQDSALNNQQRL
ncbi:MAG: ABC transporter ATP-binding protein [Alteromonadaceae bacterium]|nr:ABC transporter ATP-binding protein [Alteromonadaceae bacterium]